MTSHRSACPVSLAGDSLLQTLSKYTCYSFPTRQRRLARPDKAIYPPPAPACADAIANVFPSAGDQYVWKQTNNPAPPGGLFPFSRPPLGAPDSRCTQPNQQASASPESTPDTINSAGSTVLRMNTAAHMCHSKDQHPSSLACQVLVCLQNAEPREEY